MTRATLSDIGAALVFVACIGVIGFVVFVWLP